MVHREPPDFGTTWAPEYGTPTAGSSDVRARRVPGQPDEPCGPTAQPIGFTPTRRSVQRQSMSLGRTDYGDGSVASSSSCSALVNALSAVATWLPNLG